MEIYDFCGGGDYKRKYGGEEIQRFLLCKSKYRWTAMARGMAFRLFKMKQRILGFGKGLDRNGKSGRQERDR